MSSSRNDSVANGSGKPERSSNPPLVIVSERGRHSEAARRIVRAQAARASAAQSRETRARNREDRHTREGRQSSAEEALNPTTHSRSSPVPRGAQEQPQFHNPVPESNQNLGPIPRQGNQYDHFSPLVSWVTNVLRLSPSTFAGGRNESGRPSPSNTGGRPFNSGSLMADSGVFMGVDATGSPFSRKLPVALPKGFANLQTRIQMSDSCIVLLSRTACFDYASPGVENRLNELLFDLAMIPGAAAAANPGQPPNHPILAHLRLACTCLTIFQGQRADGAPFAGIQNYNLGLAAAWEEALVLDPRVLQEPKCTEAAIWAMFIISVTCESPVGFFHQALRDLMRDLQLHYWEQVRGVLLDFIYPGSVIEGPCRRFWETLQGQAPPN